MPSAGEKPFSLVTFFWAFAKESDAGCGAQRPRFWFSGC
jgi:hypothetical protein